MCVDVVWGMHAMVSVHFVPDFGVQPKRKGCDLTYSIYSTGFCFYPFHSETGNQCLSVVSQGRFPNPQECDFAYSAYI